MSPTRFASRRVRAFHWLPPKGDIVSDIKIDSVSIKTKIWSAEFTRALCPEIGSFVTILDNNNEEFSGKYSGDETVEFFIDRTDGTIRRFKGEIDTIFPQNDDSKGFTIKLAGNHISGELLTIPVTASYSGDTTCDAILKELIDDNLTGYTYTNVLSSTEKPTVNWDDKPFWECVFDLCKLAKTGVMFDAYVDDDKDFHFFEEKTIKNNKVAIVMGISLISAPSGIGKQSLTKRDKIKVYGEAGELPVISTSGTGSKVKTLFDSKITTIAMAEELSAAQLSLDNQEPREGEGECFMLEACTPGDYIWYSNPPQRITEQIKLYKYTQKLPIERTKVFLQTARQIPHIFKKRIETELALQTVTNPFKMENTILSFTFDDYTGITARDSNVKVEDGIIKLSSGTEGTFTATKSVSSDITNIHLQIKGSALVGTKYKFSTDGGDTLQDITPNLEISVPAGTNIWFKVFFNSASTEIDSLAVHGK